MADDEAWRYHKARAMGLVDTRPVMPVAEARRPAAAPTVRPPATAVQPQAPTAWAPPARAAVTTPAVRPFAAPATVADKGSRLMRIGGSAAALVVAAAAGWALHGAMAPQLAPRDLPMPVPVAAPVERPPVVEPMPVTSVKAVAPPAPLDEVVVPPVVPVAPKAVVVELPKLAALPKPPKAAAVKASPITGPSFNCQYASTDAQQLICASPALATLDGAVAAAYQRAVARGGIAAERRIDREQAAFLNARGQCRTPACIARLATRRLKRLDRF